MTAAIIALLAALINATLDNRRNKRRINQLESQSQINQLMRKCISETTIDRFLILKLHNGANKLLEDGILRRYLASCLNEEFKDIHTSVKDLYQLIPVDDYYKELVKKSYNLKYYEFITENEPECDLRKIYKKEKVVQSRLYFIHSSKGTIYYCSASSYKKFDFSQDDEDTINMTISKIRESYRAYYT